MYRRILVPIDGSAASMIGLRHRAAAAPDGSIIMGAMMRSSTTLRTRRRARWSFA